MLYVDDAAAAAAKHSPTKLLGRNWFVLIVVGLKFTFFMPLNYYDGQNHSRLHKDQQGDVWYTYMENLCMNKAERIIPAKNSTSLTFIRMDMYSVLLLRLSFRIFLFPFFISSSNSVCV